MGFGGLSCNDIGVYIFIKGKVLRFFVSIVIAMLTRVEVNFYCILICGRIFFRIFQLKIR